MLQKLRYKRALAIGCLLLMPATGLAQSVETNRTWTPAAAGELREAGSESLLAQAIRLTPPPVPARDIEQHVGNDQPQARQGTQGRRTPAKRILGAAVGAVGGLFIGGYTGAWIEGDRCHCDDPGLMGALIGAPVGMTVGGVLGALYLF